MTVMKLTLSNTGLIFLFLIPLLTIAHIAKSQSNVLLTYKSTLAKNGYAPMYHELYSNDSLSFFRVIKRFLPENVVTDDETGTVIVNTERPDSIEPVVVSEISRKLIHTKTFLTKNHGESYEKVIYTEPFSINWSLGVEVKKIGQYECKKATAMFRGRHYTAWFTEQIPLSAGPWKFHGLPGAIVEIYDDKKFVSFNLEKIEIPFDGSKNIPFKINSKNTISAKSFFEKRKDYNEKSEKVFLKKLLSKFPRGATIEETAYESTEIEIDF